jgi:hypothetical protein
MNITQQQQKILEALSRYRYLTTYQMMDIGISKGINSLRGKSLYRLENHRRHFIKSHDFGWIPQRGRLSKVYYLTPSGVNILSEILRIDPKTIKYPKGGIQFSSDYTHRLHFINFHIRFRQWAELNKKPIEFFYAYFDKIGSQRKGNVRSTAKTKVYLKRTVYTQQEDKTFIPDGLTRYQDGDKSRLVIIEIHNGFNSKVIIKQLLDHLEALQQGLFSQKFKHKTANFVLSVHENEATLKSVKNRLMNRAEFQPFLPLFLFNTQAQTDEDFSQNWTLADGTKTALFE